MFPCSGEKIMIIKYIINIIKRSTGGETFEYFKDCIISSTYCFIHYLNSNFKYV